MVFIQNIVLIAAQRWMDKRRYMISSIQFLIIYVFGMLAGIAIAEDDRNAALALSFIIGVIFAVWSNVFNVS